MSRRPSQTCRACDGLGATIDVYPWRKPCATYAGKGVVTIRVARALKWIPTVHRKRKESPAGQIQIFAESSLLPFVVKKPSQVSGNGQKVAGLCNTLQPTSDLRLTTKSTGTHFGG